jgi:hypothetical protein
MRPVLQKSKRKYKRLNLTDNTIARYSQENNRGRIIDRPIDLNATNRKKRISLTLELSILTMKVPSKHLITKNPR